MATNSEPLPTPKGLEMLENTTHLFIKQCVEVTEVLQGFETKNKYEVLNSRGERENQSYEFHVRVLAPHVAAVGCVVADYSITVKITHADTEELLGQVDELCHIFTPQYSIKDHNLQPKLKIRGPKWAFCCKCKLHGNVEFQIKSVEGAKGHCGRISKEFDAMELDRSRHTTIVTDADNYGVCFPQDMDPRLKATLLGAVLLIDFMYFEDDEKQERPRYEPPQH